MMEWLPRGLPSIHAPIPICVPPKSGQKRPATSPAPPIPSPHHIQSPSTTPGAGNSSGANAAAQMTSNPALLNHVMSPNQLSGLQAASLQQQQQQHQAHQQAVAAAAAAAQAQQQQMVGVPGALTAAQASARGPFASALRNLAKQADIKEEDDINVNVRVERNERAVPLGAGSSGGGGVPGGGVAVGVPAAVSVANTNVVNVSNTTRSSMSNDRLPPTGGGGGGGQISGVDERIMAKKRAGSSPQPAEKIARMSSQQSVQMQPELLARSGFQPYRSDERLIHPAGAFPLDAYATFAGLPTMPPGPFLSPAGLPYSEQLYLDQRFQMLRAAGSHHTHPHALYPPMASPYASHLYSMIPSAALGLGSALHERMKLEEEHRARIAREEEHEREMQREKEQREREREREQREREQREKEQREREQREKEQREKEQKEKEARERELREKEREARERERQILSASHHYTSQLYSPLGRNLLGPMMPHLSLGLRAPPGALHSLPPMSAYHAASQRQSPHSAMGLNLGLPGLGSVPSLSHGPGGLPHHLQQSALGLAHPSAAGLTHPGFPGAALGLSHHGINLTHPHISPHHPAMVPSHQISPHSSSIASTSTTTTSPHNLNLSMQSNAGASMKVSVPNSVSQTSVSGLQSSTSMTQATSTLSSHIPQMSNSLYHSHHSSQQHLSSAGLAPTSAHQQPSTSMPLSLTSNSGRSHSASPITMKATTQSSNNNPGMHNQNGGRSASSPHAARQLAMSQTQHQQNAGIHDKQNTLTPSALEPATLDLTGSNSNSSVQVSSVASSGGGGHNTHPNELNGGSGVEATAVGERKDSSAGIAKNLSLNVSTTDKRSPSTSPTVAAKDNAAAYNMTVSNNADDPARQCSPNSAMSTTAEPHTSVSPPAKPTIGGGDSGVHGTGAGSGNYSNNSKVMAVPSETIVKTTGGDPTTDVFALKTQSVPPPNETVLPVVSVTDVQSTATPTNTNTNSSTHTHKTSPTTTTPDACASAGGVTSTTGGSTSPPVVSSSTNIVNNKTQPKANCDETVSSATPTTTTAAIEVNGGGGGAAAGGGGGR
uniref:Protein split ends n=1 Tax=Zeugodacus cucurbitae TaxID=28588 RepID=A0A0A1X7F0_ZEUCU